MNVVETLPAGADWENAERSWIQVLGDAGCKLVNSTAGGDGWTPGQRHKQESIDKMKHNKRDLVLVGTDLSWSDVEEHVLLIYNKTPNLSYTFDVMRNSLGIPIGYRMMRQILIDHGALGLDGQRKRKRTKRQHNQIPDPVVEEIRSLRRQGLLQKEIAERVGCHMSAVGKYLKHENITVRRRAHNIGQKTAGATSPFPGVYFDRSKGRWRAQVHVNGRRVVIGTFATETDAVKARYAYLNSDNGIDRDVLRAG
jgi:hypothetical protein